ncbi:MAG: acyl carrier protein [Gemmatimonadetes bacterium]|nr:acyl carrier protein [Gemmatimonadota bacterium]
MKEIVAKTASIDVADIGDEASFMDDLELDSLTLLEIAFNVEHGYGLKLTEEEMGQITNLQQAVDLVQRHLAQKAE